MRIEYDLDSYVQKIRGGRDYFHTFIDRQSLAAGVLVLGPGEEDTQEPHDRDEVYLVLSGDGFLRIGGRDHAVSKDKLFFVARDTEHRFHGNTRELRVLYFFGA